MPTPAIKICGLTTAPTLDAAIAARANYVGFNFYTPSPRYLDLTAAAALAQRAEGRIARVGLFVDATSAVIAEAIAAARLDVLQLHGDESPDTVGQLKARFGLPVWKVIAVAGRHDLARAETYAAADLILFDAKTPKGTLPGGMGLAFDWSLLRGWKGGAWGLAGGLTPANVADAVRRTGAPLVDTSSGVETSLGVKDVELIRDFCKAARRL